MVKQTLGKPTHRYNGYDGSKPKKPNLFLNFYFWFWVATKYFSISCALD
jgi:hypothetical protein